MRRSEFMANGLFLAFISVSIFVWGQGCRVEQAQSIEGTARAEIVVSYPAAEACFVDTRVSTFDELKTCLELTTAHQWTVNAEGQIIEAIIPPGN